MRIAAGDTTRYGYDDAGRLISVLLSSGRHIEYLHDAAGRRVGRRINGVVVRGLLYLDAVRPVAELDGQGQVVSQFLYGTGRPVPDAMIRGDTTYRIVTDQVGSVRLVINAMSGAIAQRIDYDEFGRVTRNTNPGFQPFGFAGGLYDDDVQLVHFGTRDYDPQVGRWLARDPIGYAAGSTNLYAYVDNDPINYCDPFGLAPQWWEDFKDAVREDIETIKRETRQYVIRIVIRVLAGAANENEELIDKQPPIEVPAPDPGKDKDPKKFPKPKPAPGPGSPPCDDPPTPEPDPLKTLRDFLNSPVPDWFPKAPKIEPWMWPPLVGPGAGAVPTMTW